MTTILHIEDDAASAAFFRLALHEASIAAQVEHVGDAAAAYAYLDRHDRMSAAPAPDLIVLDLGLPGTPGHSILGTLKDDPRWQGIPVVVLTGSPAASDRQLGRFLGAAAYLEKPATIAGLVALGRAVAALLPR